MKESRNIALCSCYKGKNLGGSGRLKETDLAADGSCKYCEYEVVWKSRAKKLKVKSVSTKYEELEYPIHLTGFSV